MCVVCSKAVNTVMWGLKLGCALRKWQGKNVQASGCGEEGPLTESITNKCQVPSISISISAK